MGGSVHNNILTTPMDKLLVINMGPDTQLKPHLRAGRLTLFDLSAQEVSSVSVLQFLHDACAAVAPTGQTIINWST